MPRRRKLKKNGTEATGGPVVRNDQKELAKPILQIPAVHFSQDASHLATIPFLSVHGNSGYCADSDHAAGA